MPLCLTQSTYAILFLGDSTSSVHHLRLTSLQASSAASSSSPPPRPPPLGLWDRSGPLAQLLSREQVSRAAAPSAAASECIAAANTPSRAAVSACTSYQQSCSSLPLLYQQHQQHLQQLQHHKQQHDQHQPPQTQSRQPAMDVVSSVTLTHRNFQAQTSQT